MKENRKQILILIWLLAFVISLLYSKFVLTLSMMLLTISAVVFNFKTFRFTFLKFIKAKHFSLFSVYFIIILLSLILGGISDYGLDRLRIALPYAILPFAFYAIPKISTKHYMWVWLVFLVTLAISEFHILIQFFQDESQYIHDIKKGHALPTPVHHIRYSLLVGVGVLGSLWWSIYKNNYRYLFLGFALFNFIFIHFLAVKTGIICLYAGMFVFLINYIVQKRKFLIGSMLLLVLMATPYLAYKSIPSLHSKVNYMLWDIKQYNHGKIDGYSDGQRIRSLIVGKEVIKENFFFGTGIGSFEKVINTHYSNNYPKITSQLKPHNQFMSIWASMGLIGLLIVCFSWLGILLTHSNYKDPFLAFFFVFIFCSFFIENTLGTAVGTAIFLFFSLLHLKYKETYTS